MRRFAEPFRSNKLSRVAELHERASKEREGFTRERRCAVGDLGLRASRLMRTRDETMRERETVVTVYSLWEFDLDVRSDDRLSG